MESRRQMIHPEFSGYFKFRMSLGLTVIESTIRGHIGVTSSLPVNRP